MHAITTFGEDIEFAVSRQQFHFDSLAHLLPWAFTEFSLQFAQPPLRRTDDIGDRWVARPHFSKDFLGGNAAIHYPDAFGFAILGLDLFEKGTQSGLIAGVAREHFISQRKSFRVHDQCNNDLHTIRPLIAAVTELPLVLLGKGWVTFEIRACQIIEQHLELRIEEIAPALLEMGKERLFMLEQTVMDLVDAMAFGQREIAAEQIGHRALLEPLAVKTPFASRIDQSIGTKSLKHEIPSGAFATGRQPLCPEPIEVELLVELAGHPVRQLPDRGRCSSRLSRRIRTMFSSGVGAIRSWGNSATVRGCALPSSKISMVLRHASRWLSLISPR